MLSVSSELSDLNGRIAAVEREILELSGCLGPQTFTTVADIRRTLVHSSHSYLREAVEALTTDCGALESSIEKVTSKTAPVLQDVERLDSLSQRLDSVLVLVRANLRLRRLVQAASRLQIRCEAEGYPLLLLEESVALFREGVELENSLSTQNNIEISQLSTELRGLRGRVQAVVDQGFDAAVSALMSGDEKSIDAVKSWMQLASTLGVEEEATLRYASCLRHQISLAGSQARSKLLTSDDDFPEALVHVFGAVADGFQDFLSTIGLTCTTEQSMAILRAVQEEADLQASRLLTCFEQAHTKLLKTVIVTDASVGKYDALVEKISHISRRIAQFEKYTQGLGRDILAKGDVYEIAPNYSKDHGLLAEPESCRSIQGLRAFAVGVDLEILRLSIKLAEVEDRTDVQRVSSFVDDVFYVAGRLLMRSLAGNDVHSVCATVNNIANVLATEVLATMATHVQNAQPAFATWFETSRRQDAAPEKPLNGSRACDSLPHALNNICYSKTCVQELSRRVSSNFDESELLTNSISHLSAVCADLSSAETVGAGVLVETLMPFYNQLLSPLQVENFSTDLSVAGRSGWVDHFVEANRDLFTRLTSAFLPAALSAIVESLLGRLTAQIETFSFSARDRKFTFLGGVQWDTDVRALSAAFTGISNAQARQIFRRLLDIGEILTVDSVETLSDSLSASRDWRLSREDFRQLLTMRVDLDQDSISRLVSLFTIFFFLVFDYFIFSRFFNERHFIAGLQ